VAALALVVSAKRLRGVGDDRAVRAGLAAGLVGNELISWIYFVAQGRFGLPLQLCDLAVWLMAWALIGTNRVVGELAFFWGLAGSSQAVLTPDLREGFPSYPWLYFFLGHCGVVLSAVYLAARGRLSVSVRSVWRVWLISNGYVVIAGLLNWWLGTNFGYLARKPAHPSLLDYLGPWPVYIVGIEVIALVLFFLCLGLSRAIDRWAGAHA
jgi:hypothetical integral membrane protein (TIGR02206 family)